MRQQATNKISPTNLDENPTVKRMYSEIELNRDRLKFFWHISRTTVVFNINSVPVDDNHIFGLRGELPSKNQYQHSDCLYGKLNSCSRTRWI